MTLRLSVDLEPWRAHVAGVARQVLAAGDLVAVVKGNGYGVGRTRLIAEARPHTRSIAVGTVHEAFALGLDETSTELEVQVLTPPVEPVGPSVLGRNVVLTVGTRRQAQAAEAHTGPVSVKLRSSMQRYGAAPDELEGVLGALAARGKAVHEYVLHLPLLAGGRDDHAQVAEIDAWADRLPAGVPMSVSHLSSDAFAELAARRTERRWRLRTGTALWHGDKSFVHLQADVVDTRVVHAGEIAGYRGTPIDADGTLVMVGAGSTHGVTPLADGRSPFHFERTRVALFETPHMHTSMCFVPAGSPTPSPGDLVDVQRPLTAVAPDEVVFA